MAQGFILQQGVQEGTFNLNDTKIKFEIKQNLDNQRYFIDMFTDDEPLIIGKYLENGTDLLYNKSYLELGESLVFRGDLNTTQAFLIYTE